MSQHRTQRFRYFELIFLMGVPAGFCAALHRHVFAVDAAAREESSTQRHRSGADHPGDIPARFRAGAIALRASHRSLWQKTSPLLQPRVVCNVIGCVRSFDVGERAVRISSAAGDRSVRRRGGLSRHGARPFPAGGFAPHLFHAGACAGCVTADRAVFGEDICWYGLAGNPFFSRRLRWAR